MAALIPPMLKYSIAYNLPNFPPILIKFVSRLRSPLKATHRLKRYHADKPYLTDIQQL